MVMMMVVVVVVLVTRRLFVAAFDGKQTRVKWKRWRWRCQWRLVQGNP